MFLILPEPRQILIQDASRAERLEAERLDEIGGVLAPVNVHLSLWGKKGEKSLNAGPRVVEGVVACAYQGPARVPGLIFTGPGLRRFPRLEAKIRRHLRLGLRRLGRRTAGIPSYIYQPFHVLGKARHLTG